MRKQPQTAARVVPGQQYVRSSASGVIWMQTFVKRCGKFAIVVKRGTVVDASH